VRALRCQCRHHLEAEDDEALFVCTTSVIRTRRTAEVPEDPNISSIGRKILSEHPKGVARAYVLVYIETCWDN
jgi:hypothetical protein